MARVAEFIARDLTSGDFWLGPFRSDVGCFLGLWHRGLGVIVVVLDARSFCGAKIRDPVCHELSQPGLQWPAQLYQLCKAGLTEV